MTFASIPFLFYFLPIFLAAYFASPWKNAALLTASLIFYAWGEPIYILGLVISILVNHAIGQALVGGRRSWMLALGVGANVAALAVFKYAGFILSGAAGFGGPDAASLPFATHLPLGISFYTFQAISFLVDTYRGDARPSRRVRDTALYIAMFPQLIAGPIVRFQTVAAQIQRREHSYARFADGAGQFVQGLAQKVLLANAFAVPADAAFGADPGMLGAAAAWLGLAAYMLQIYFDFAGYSNMALGLGRMMGFDFPRNFDFPYVSQSVTEFWRRWHMSLSRWFRDYLYIPLGGNRRGRWTTYRNLWIVFLLCGLWHGAALAFVAWGAYHGALLVLERTRFGSWLGAAPRPLRHLYLLLVVMLGWTPFRTEDLGAAWSYYGALLGLHGVDAAFSEVYAPGLETVFLIGAVVALWPIIGSANRSLSGWLGARGGEGGAIAIRYGSTAALGGLLVVCAAELASGAYNPFIYFRF